MQTLTMRLRTSGPEQTRAVGAALAELLQPGDVVALSGELGAGKTCLVQGAARGLGITARVTSPTFVLVRLYDEGRLPVVHCDVYRLDQLQDVYDLGDEVLAPDVVTFVEWADAVLPLLPDDRLDVDVLLADDGDDDGDDRAGVTPTAGRRDPTDALARRGTGDETVDAGDEDEDVEVEGDRVVVVTARGAWHDRASDLVRTCAPWRDGPGGGVA